MKVSGTAATDKRASAGVKVYRQDRTGPIASVGATTPSHTDPNLTSGAYTYWVAAFDASGNESVPSATVSARVR